MCTETMSQVSLGALQRRQRKRQISLPSDPLQSFHTDASSPLQTSWFPLNFSSLRQSPDLPLPHLFLALSIPTIALVFRIGGIQHLSTLVGFLLPLYQTFRALEVEASDDDEGKHMHWLQYWIVFGVLHVVLSHGGDWILSSLLPGYFWVKLGFVCWIMHPKSGGVETCYLYVIKPLYELYGKELDVYLDFAVEYSQQTTEQIMENTFSNASQALATLASNVIKD